MELQQQLIDIEQKLWTNDPVLYRNSFIEEALLIFPETGMITRDAAIDAILIENVENRRWAEVQFSAVRSSQLADDVILLTIRPLPVGHMKNLLTWYSLAVSMLGVTAHGS